MISVAYTAADGIMPDVEREPRRGTIYTDAPGS
jgi:hypothetical protein